ncbi:MAG: NADH-quinone oxidoreductase subunit M [Acidobacteriia bacterium]|nr:NADH-quinone oxidoreductase subunit M [Terriglobia bacterium]MYC66582.1 NADH-quinone oxidoreductase subunit M [Terriglobia bacterium]
MTSLFTEHLITSLITVPFAGIVALLFVRGDVWVRRVAMGVSLLALGLSAALWWRFDPSIEGMQFVERTSWMENFNIQYAVGVDGISLVLVMLTTLLGPLCVLASWTSIESKVKAYMILILLVEGAMIVVFTALDLFLFFMLWEVTMVPMYFMIILWGGPGRIQAGIKFVLYSLTGSLLLLVAILGLYLQTGRSFDIQAMVGHAIPEDVQIWIFAFLFLGFAIKLPMVPFHSWLPDAHSEAPTAGSVILAGVLLKMGGYGFLRICLPILPEAAAEFAPYILWLSIVGIIYGGCLALAQSDLKKLVAYSSISHMGFVTLGIFAFNEQGIEGAVIQMFAHGMSTGALFLAIGFLYDRTHTRMIADYGGLQKPMPRFVVLLSIFAMASFGLPGMGNFTGEFLVLLGTSFGGMLKVLLAMSGIVLAAAYMLWMLQRVVLGQPRTSLESLPDLNAREIATLVPLVVGVFVVGLIPATLTTKLDSTVKGMLDRSPAIVQSASAPGE